MGHSHQYTASPKADAKTAAIRTARQKLIDAEKQEIDRLIKHCAKSRIRDFGPAAAEQFLGKLGMLLVEMRL